MNKKGFTLLELIVAIAILSITTGVVAININSTRFANSTNCSKQIISMLDRIKTETMSKENIVYLLLYKEKEEYFITTTTTPEAVVRDSKVDKKIASERLQLTYTLEGGVEELPIDEEGILIGFARDTGAFLPLYNHTSYLKEINIYRNEVVSKLVMVRETGRYYLE